MCLPAVSLFCLLAGWAIGAAASRTITVAADGSGEFTTVQAAIDVAPSGAATRTIILVRRGTYAELLLVLPEKVRLTIRGEDRKQTIIAATNNAKLNPSRRELVSLQADDFILESITLHNTTPKGGTQAETLKVKADRCVLRHCDFKIFQDTLQLTGRVYVDDCYVEGDVDYVCAAARSPSTAAPSIRFTTATSCRRATTPCTSAMCLSTAG